MERAKRLLENIQNRKLWKIVGEATLAEGNSKAGNAFPY